MKNHELAKKEIFPLFIKYAIPSIGAMLIITIYTVVDAIFVGRGVGAVALGAVNQATPLILLINAFAAALATGAGIVISIRLGQKKKREANVAFTTIAIFNTILALLITTMGLLFTDNIATFLGANADTFGYVTSYLSIILYFMIFFVMQITLSTIVRNDGNPNLALIGLLVGISLNIPLDYLFIFVFDWGLEGAAIATGLSQAIGALILCTHFIFNKGLLRFDFKYFKFSIIKEIALDSIPIFITGINMSLIIFIMNLLAKNYYGTLGISAFAIIGSITMVIVVLLLGISQAIQPIVSFNLGIDCWDRIDKTLRTGILASFFTAIVLIAIISIFSEFFIRFYVVDNLELITFTQKALRLFLFAYLFQGANMVYTIYFQSIKDNKNAMIISILRSLILLPILAFLLPVFFGGTSIWFIVSVTELLTFIVALFLSKKSLVKRNYYKSIKASDKNELQNFCIE